jgi:hypothetical protein
VEVKTLFTDAELDKIGNGINTTLGIKFYIGNDNENWELLGTEYDGMENIYTVELDTSRYRDGEYQIKVNASDLDGFEVEQIINIHIDNPGRKPSVILISPTNQTELQGVFQVKAKISDFDDDVNTSGVNFYITTSKGKENWFFIGNDSDPGMNHHGDYIYSFEWFTVTVPDDWYKMKVEVIDEEGLSNESYSSEFKVHNNEANAPIIRLMYPTGGEELQKSQMITVRIWDLEDNINTQGVNYYYSKNKIQWNYIGTANGPRIGELEYYDFMWNTDTVPDGEYWLNVSVSDETQLESWQVTDQPVLIHNNLHNPPVIELLIPYKGQHISGSFKLQAFADDLEDNIGSSGVVFYFSSDKEDWIVISNVPSPNNTVDKVYELIWDISIHTDGKYWLRVDVEDTDGLKVSAYSDYFFIHNNQNNLPEVSLLGPHSGEIKGTIKMNATVFDLENNIDNKGMNFYYSTDLEYWTFIGNDQTGSPMDEEEMYYELYWNTFAVPDDIYWLRAEATDLTSLVGFDLSDDKITVHNKETNPPRVTLKSPRTGIPLDPIQSIIVEVVDFDSDVDSVSFYYSKDNAKWELIDCRFNPELGNTYKTMWDTGKIPNGKYYIKIIATDKMGNTDELMEGLFEVSEGIEKNSDSSDSLGSSDILWVVVIVVIIIIMALVMVMLMKRSKRREKELIKEVSSELKKSMAMENGTGEEIVPGVVAESDNSPAQSNISENNDYEYTNGSADPNQTYIPASESPLQEVPESLPDVETVESYKIAMEAWKAEGYNVSGLEQLISTDENMFARSFPIYSANISELKDISGKLSAMDSSTSGQSTLANSIKSKIYEPDLATEVKREFNELQMKLGIIPRAAPINSSSNLPGAVPEAHNHNLPNLTRLQQLPSNQSSNPLTTPVARNAPEAGLEGTETFASCPPPISHRVPEPASEPVQPNEVPPDIELPPEITLPPEVEEDPVIPESPFASVQTQSLEDELNGRTGTLEIPNDPEHETVIDTRKEKVI